MQSAESKSKPEPEVKTMPAPRETFSVLFFDNECGLCHSGVRFFLKHDTGRALRYAPLQSSLGKKVLLAISPLENLIKPEPPEDNLNTLILLKNYNPHQNTINKTDIRIKSDAVLSALNQLSSGGNSGWSLLAHGLALIPKKNRDIGYDYIARHRNQLPFFKDACKVPTEEERKWFVET